MAENLKDYGSFIPGYRPGRRTADYLEKVMLRITYVGAAFLSLVAVIPSLVQNALNVDYTVASFLGGTGLLIVISVCLDLVQKIDSHLIMRNYGGLGSKRRRCAARPRPARPRGKDEGRVVIKLKSPREIALMREAGRVVAQALDQ